MSQTAKDRGAAATGARLITKTSVRADEKATLTVAPLVRAIEAKATSR
ncbi:hypothetical protein [Streptomyces sp. NPDC004728]